jgi:phage terminase small subunit
MAGKLTPKQERFVEEYLVDLNATKAAERAGYSARTANEQGARLLANVSVQEAIQAAKAKRAKKIAVSAEDVLRGVIEVTMLAREEGDLKTALKGYELQGKHIGMWRDKVEQEISGPGGGPVEEKLVIELVRPKA